MRRIYARTAKARCGGAHRAFGVSSRHTGEERRGGAPGLGGAARRGSVYVLEEPTVRCTVCCPPSRVTCSVTCCPGVSAATAFTRSELEVIGVLSSWVITSPTLRPATEAGLPALILPIRAPPEAASWIETPRNGWAIFWPAISEA